MCVNKITIIGSDNQATSHYLNQCWYIVNLTLRNKLQWNINHNWYIFTQENTFEHVVWKMAAVLSRPRCVKWYIFSISRHLLTINQNMFFYAFISAVNNINIHHYSQWMKETSREIGALQNSWNIVRYSTSQELCILLVFCNVLLCFGPDRLYPYPSGLLHWHWDNHMIAPMPVK